MVEPVPVYEIIKPYINYSSENSILNVKKFNNENSQLGKIVPLVNRKDYLEFLLFFDKSNQILYYNNGTEIFYEPKNDR